MPDDGVSLLDGLPLKFNAPAGMDQPNAEWIVLNLGRSFTPQPGVPKT